MANPRTKKTKKSSATAKLSAALDFVMPAYGGKLDYMEYCRIGNGQIVAFNSVMAIGHKIDEDLALCPHLGKLGAAIKQAGETLNMTELDSGRLSIKGDNIRVTIPCMNGLDLPPAMPDQRIAPLNDDLKIGMEVVNTLLREGDEKTRMIELCCLLRANTIVSNNGYVALEYWHGIDLPPGLTIPRQTLLAIKKTPKTLTGFGYSERTATFFFDDDAWIRTQLYTDPYPDIDRVMNDSFGNKGPQDLAPIPEAFFEACASVMPFSENGPLLFSPGKVQTHREEEQGASYDIPGLEGYHAFAGQLLDKISPYAQTYEILDDRMIFFGDRIRGIVMKMRA